MVKRHTRAEFVSILREMANLYEQLPEGFPQPYDLNFKWLSVFLDKGKERQQLALLGSFEKRFDKQYSDQFAAVKHMGKLELTFRADRDAVCERKIVGTRIVPEEIIPAEPAKEAQVIPAHEEPIIEWDCQSILAPETVAADAAQEGEAKHGE